MLKFNAFFQAYNLQFVGYSKNIHSPKADLQPLQHELNLLIIISYKNVGVQNFL